MLLAVEDEGAALSITQHHEMGFNRATQVTETWKYKSADGMELTTATMWSHLYCASLAYRYRTYFHF
jgi:hypothetical protein